MIRTQTQLPEEQHQRLKDLAHRGGISLAELIRRLLAERLEQGSLALDRADKLEVDLAVCGRHRDPEVRSNVAADHDRHLVRSLEGR
jgi:hypothetical protein